MKTKNTKGRAQNKTFTQVDGEKYYTDRKYKRPVYYQTLDDKAPIERFLRYDEARDEARTLTRKIIKHCRRKGIGFSEFLSRAIISKAQRINSVEVRIIKESPPSTLYEVVASLKQFEKRTNKPITTALSIKPQIGWDLIGYFVKGVVLEDDPAKIYRKYKENKLVDAF